jgi:hypothetical protein
MTNIKSPAQGFIDFYEKCLVAKRFRFIDYFQEQFDYQSPIKYEVQFHSSPPKQLISLCNAILKNLRSNSFFENNAAADIEYSQFIQIYGPLYFLIKGVVLNQTYDENWMTRLIILLYLSKERFSQEVFDTFFIRLNSVKIADSKILSQHDYTVELEELYLKIIHNDKIRNISVNIIKNINCFKKQHADYDVNKIKLVFIVDQFDGLFGYAGIDSIYVSLNTFSKLNMDLDKESKMIILKIDFIRLIQHELTHVLLRESADNLNISTPDILKNKNRDELIKESGIIAEVTHFGGRIDWVESSFSNQLNFEYCKNYIKRIEANEQVNFEIEKANIILKSSKICCTALDMTTKNKVSYE